MKKTIKEFDIQVQEFIDSISKKKKKLYFDENTAVEFTLNECLDDSVFQTIKDGDQGVYLFELNLASSNLKGAMNLTKIDNFQKKWHTNPYNFNYSSNIIDKRLKMYDKNFTADWLPIYIGKCKDVKKRVLNHLTLPSQSKTYALKLKARKNLHGCVFRVSYIQLNMKNYDFIAPFIEKVLRDSYNPIIGRQ